MFKVNNKDMWMLVGESVIYEPYVNDKQSPNVFSDAIKKIEMRFTLDIFIMNITDVGIVSLSF